GTHSLRVAGRRLPSGWIGGSRQSRRRQLRGRDGARGAGGSMKPMKPLRGLRRNRDPNRPRAVRRVVVLMPNGLTLFNLFCGIYAIVLATRNEFATAPAFIVLGGIADALDGRVARATGTGSRFGEELDSLVDAISFGFAPALIMYLEIPN